MFEVERFVADCRAAFAEDTSHKAVREVLASAMSDPSAVLKGLGEPKRAEIRKLFHSDSLTIINVVWAPKMELQEPFKSFGCALSGGGICSDVYRPPTILNGESARQNQALCRSARF
jgi:hypothetical protein